MEVWKQCDCLSQLFTLSLSEPALVRVKLIVAFSMDASLHIMSRFSLRWHPWDVRGDYQ